MMDVTSMSAKLGAIWPELILVLAAFVVMIVGLSPLRAARRATYGITLVALTLAGLVAAAGGAMGLTQVSPLALFVKIATCLIGIGLVVGASETVEAAAEETEPFDAATTSRGEFFGFMLLSLVGLMLCAGADDLIWLFLALELTSLPTYVMVTTSRRQLGAAEAGVKYFFLGAMAAAVFLYGFALIYGATGTTVLPEIHEILAGGRMADIGIAGFVLAIVGIGFKIAAVPMHVYAADVYQGAATPVTAFLAYVPKAAGFAALILLLGAIGWPLEHQSPVFTGLLWAMAVATMFVGNTLALMQTNVKRMLAYSSVAHSGYMLVGLVAGPGVVGESEGLIMRNGIAAVLFYLVTYGVTNLGAFAVLSLLERDGDEAQKLSDLRGLARRRPAMAAVLALCVLSLTGIPPLVGFWAKLTIIGSAISGGFYVLAVLTVINSAIAAFYYLKIVAVCYLQEPDEQVVMERGPGPVLAAVGSALVVVAVSLAAGPVIGAARDAAAGFKPHSPAPVQAEAEGGSL
jgi:NADH-quinone oxidoreductase subunit N